MKHCHRIMSCLLALFLMCGTACAESIAPEVAFSLPDGHILLKYVWITDEQKEALLLLGSEAENAVQLAIATQAATGQYLLTALSQPILSYDEYDPELSYLYVAWQDGSPGFWWGFRNDIITDEIYLSLRQDERHGWVAHSGYVKRVDPQAKYVFFLEEPGILTVNGDTPYPQICWTKDFPMALDGFDLQALEGVCWEALAYLDAFADAHGAGAQDGEHFIRW